VKLPGRSDYRPAFVDPKAFFAPGRTDWTPQEKISAFGTHNTVCVAGGWVRQDNYAAIVLVNPATDSGPLKLTATIVKGTPRQVSLMDDAGRPVVGVETQGMTPDEYDYEPPLRAASFPLLKLHPQRFRRITFVKEDRQLIGFLLARGDGDSPYEVRMQPWATITGRLLNDEGRPFKANVSMDNLPDEALADPTMGERQSVACAADGRFRIDKLVPGQRYTGKVHAGIDHKFAGLAFENLVLKPGETRDLGDVRLASPRVAWRAHRGDAENAETEKKNRISASRL
jgi:hypothetical protein